MKTLAFTLFFFVFLGCEGTKPFGANLQSVEPI
jgi:hypothetical protein